MGSITDIKSILTRKGFDIFCQKFHIHEEVHPELPSPNQTIHEMPTGKIGVYTRFFEFANFRLPLSTFLVDILRYYRIHLSQLSIIGAAKVSHFEILCRVHNIEPTVGLFRCLYVNSKNKGWMSFSKHSDVEGVCYTKPLDSLKHWNEHFFWVDSFSCPVSFPWHTAKYVSKDPFPKSTDFNANHYVILVAHPALFRKFPEPFLCLVGMSRYYTFDENTYPRFLYDDGTEMDLLAFIHVADPTKVRVVERERVVGEVKLLDSTVGRAVPLLPVAPARAASELEASVDKLFDEGGGANQGDSATGGSNDAEIEPVTTSEDTAAVTAERPKRHRKKRPAVADASGSSHPPKKLRGEGGHRASSGVATGGKSPSVVRELLASSLLNVETGVEAVATLPFVTSSVSATPEREDDNLTDSVTGANLRTIAPAERFVISTDSSHHSSTHASGAKVASVIRSAVPPPVITKAVITAATAGIPSAPVPETSAKVNTSVHASMFHDSDSVGTVKPDVAGPSHLPRKELSLGSREVDFEHLHEVFIPHWNISNDALLDDLDTFREFIDHLAPPVLFSQIRDMDYEQLFTEFNVGTARQVFMNAKVRMQTEYCLSERKRLELECVDQANLLKAKDDEVERLKAQLLLKEAEAAETIRLHAQVSIAEATEKIHADEIETLKQRNVALKNEKNSLDGKVTELQSLVSTKDLELKDLNAALSSLQFQNDGLLDQVHALEATCFGLRERLSRYENLTERFEEFQDAQLKVVNDKVAKLDADLAEMACHLEEKLYPHLLTTISGQRWLLTHGLKLVLVKCLNSSEYLTALGAAISRAIEKGMQDGLVAGIDHDREGRSLIDVVAYKPSAEADFNSALQELHEIDFPLLAELKSHKDASVEDIMNLLRLEGPLADAPGMGDLQPDIEQLKVPIHRSEDQVVLGETSLSFALSVSHSRVKHIRANIAAERSALLDVWTPLSEPLSVQNLIGA
ncbi:hypothetical protein Tco_1038135, partial [Tanacetum coccineum]